MKKQLLALGTLLATLAFVGCSGSTERPVAQGSGQQESTLNAGLESGSTTTPIVTDAETVRIGSINFYVDYDEALADAKQSGRPVWLHFGENPG